MRKINNTLSLILILFTLINFNTLQAMGTTNTAVVIELTSSWIRVGLANENTAKVQFPAVVGVPKHVLPGIPPKSYVGDEAMSKRGILNIKYPIENGAITKWSDWKLLMQEAYTKLSLAYNTQPLLLVCNVNMPTGSRTKMEQEMKALGVTSVKVVLNAEMVLKNTGLTTGTVLHAESDIISIVPIYQGEVQTNSIVSVPIGENDLTDYLVKILQERGYGFTLGIDTEREEARDILETICYAAYDFEAEMETAASSSKLEKTYTRLNGETITIGNERFRTVEALFQPIFIGMESAGIHQATRDAINKCGADQQAALYSNIILAGENTLHTGLQARLKKEVSALTSNPVTVSDNTNADLKVWKGAATYARTTTF